MKIEHYLQLAFIQTTLSAVVAILAFIKFRSRDETIRLIGCVFVTGALANIVAYLLHSSITLRGYMNLAHPVYIVITLCLYSRIYFILLGKKHAKVFLTLTIAFVFFALFNVFFIQGTSLNSYSKIFYSAIILVYCLLYFYVLMKDLPSLYLHHLPMFWFNSALLIFHAGTFFFFCFQDYLVNVLKNDLLVYASLHNLWSIVMHFIFIIGLYYDLISLKTDRAESSFSTQR